MSRASHRNVGHNTQFALATSLIFLLWLSGLSAWAQTPLSLKEAVRTALENNRSIVASSAAQRAAESKIQEARSGFLPKVDYSESWTRSDNPVFVFSSLLTQHQFGAENFLLGPLNRPDFLNNFQSLVTADQTLFDAGKTRHAVRSAGLTEEITGEDQRLTQMQVIATVVRAYYDAALSSEQLKAADQAARSAEADLQQAENVRAAGLSTDADVLSRFLFTAFVGFNLFQSAFTNWCPMMTILRKLGVPDQQPHELPQVPHSAPGTRA